MNKIFRRIFFIIGLSAGLASCKKSDSPLTKETPLEIDSIAANYYEQYLKLYPLVKQWQ